MASFLYSISSVEKHGSNIFSPVARRWGGIPAPLAYSSFIIEKQRQGVDRVAEDQNSITPAFAPVKLRQAIKGISIAAITYYLLSILHLVLEGCTGISTPSIPSSRSSVGCFAGAANRPQILRKSLP